MAIGGYRYSDVTERCEREFVDLKTELKRAGPREYMIVVADAQFKVDRALHELQCMRQDMPVIPFPEYEIEVDRAIKRVQSFQKTVDIWRSGKCDAWVPSFLTVQVNTYKFSLIDYALFINGASIFRQMFRARPAPSLLARVWWDRLSVPIFSLSCLYKLYDLHYSSTNRS